MKFTIYLRLVERLRMSGAVPALFVCAFGVCAGANLTLYSINHKLFVM
jgi:hypothetical protein